MKPILNQVITLPRWLLLFSIIFIVFWLFWLGIYVGSKCDFQDYSMSTESVEESSSNENNSTKSVCSEFHFNQSADDSHWEQYVEADDSGIFFLEANATLDVLCKRRVFSFEQRESWSYEISYVKYHEWSTNEYASFIDGAHMFTVLDIETGREVVKVPVYSDSYDFNIYYSAASGDTYYEYILVVPYTLPTMGCGGEPGCAENMAQTIQEDWAREDVYATVIRTDGMYVEIPRNTLTSWNVQTDLIEIDNYLLIQEWTIDGRKQQQIPLSEFMPVEES